MSNDLVTAENFRGNEEIEYVASLYGRELSPDAVRRLFSVASIMSSTSEISGYGLAVCLAIFRDNQAYRRLEQFADAKFSDFVAALDIPIERAAALLRTHDRLRAAGVVPSLEVARLGMTRLTLLASVVTQDTAEQWLRVARALSVRELRERVAAFQRGEVQSPDPADDAEGAVVPESRSALRLSVTESQREMFFLAFERVREIAKKRIGNVFVHDSDCLEFIVTEWLANHADPKLDAVSWLTWVIDRLAAAYDIDIVYTISQRLSKKSLGEREGDALESKGEGDE